VDFDKKNMETNIFLSSISILSTVFVGIWLTHQNKALSKVIESQGKIIEDQSKQISGIKSYTDIIEKFTDPKETEKLLETKLQLIKHDNEIQLRHKLEAVTNTITEEYIKKLELDGKQKYGKSYNELANFAISSFLQADFSGKTERNLAIKETFPTFGPIFIKYLDEHGDKILTANNDL
jgi:histidyl-tRNA synthetase